MISDIPILDCGDFISVSARSLVWKANELTNGTALQAGAGKLLAEIITSNPIFSDSICLDCNGIFSIGDHALNSTAKALEQGSKSLVLINGEQCVEQFCLAFKRHNITGRNLKSAGVWMFSKAKITSDEPGIDYKARTEVEEQAELDRIVIKSYRNLPGGQERLQSTPLLANGVFNARSIASLPREFMLVTVSMARKIEFWLRSNPHSGSIRLLSVSLRASPFAAGISQILKIPVEIIDHMGPKMKILEQYSLQKELPPDYYIYVGDFTVGGSELKIAETFAVTKGSSLILSAVIGTILNPALYSPSGRLLTLVCASECSPLRNLIGDYKLI